MTKKFKKWDENRIFRNYRDEDFNVIDQEFDRIDLTDVDVEHQGRMPEKKNREYDEWK